MPILIAAISEESPFVPRTAYGRTKLRGEHLIRERSGPDGYSWTILRLPTVYGPGQKPSGLFDQMIRMASSGAMLGRIDWPGRTSIIHVDDAVDVMVDLAGRGEAADQVYCLASDESLTVGELARKIGEVLGRPVSAIGPAPSAAACDASVDLEPRRAARAAAVCADSGLALEPDSQRWLLVRYDQIQRDLRQTASKPRTRPARYVTGAVSARGRLVHRASRHRGTAASRARIRRRCGTTSQPPRLAGPRRRRADRHPAAPAPQVRRGAPHSGRSAACVPVDRARCAPHRPARRLTQPSHRSAGNARRRRRRQPPVRRSRPPRPGSWLRPRPMRPSEVMRWFPVLETVTTRCGSIALTRSRITRSSAWLTGPSG